MKTKRYQRFKSEKIWKMDIAPSQKLVMLAIAQFHEKGINPTAAELGSVIGLSQNAVQLNRKALEEEGFLVPLIC